MKKTILIFALSCFAITGHTAELIANHTKTHHRVIKGRKQVTQYKQTTLTLSSINAIKLSEKHGDEIYLDLLIFGSNKKPQHQRVPTYPHHWPSRFLPKVNDVALWQDLIMPKDEVKIIVSLLEKDAPPWNVNDLIGSFELILSRTMQGVTVNYQIPEHPQSSLTAPLPFKKSVTLSSDDATYQLQIELKS